MAAPSKVKVQQVIAIGMAVIFAVRLPVLLRSFGMMSRPANGPMLPGVVPTAPPPPQPTASVSGSAPELPDGAAPVGPAVKYTAETARDPLVNLLPKEGSGQVLKSAPTGLGSSAPVAPPHPPQVTVEGIIWGGSRPQALLNGRVYELGEMVQGAKIVAITQQGVTVEVAGARFLFEPKQESSRVHGGGEGASGVTRVAVGSGGER